MANAVHAVLGDLRDSIAALTVDCTGSSPTAVDAQGRPLALRSDFDDDSAEWYWSKILRIIRTNPRVARAAAGSLEHSDWFPAMLCNVTSLDRVSRNRCGAAHKALWHTNWGGFPPADFFEQIDGRLGAVRRSLPRETYPSNHVFGYLGDEWSGRTGLPAEIPIGVGLFDAHASAIGAGIRTGVISKVIGTSSAEMAVADSKSISGGALSGIESQAEGFIIPELVGIEAGQPAYGDLFHWFSSMIAGEISAIGAGPTITADEVTMNLSTRARKRKPAFADPVTLDWINGRRASFPNGAARACIEGLSLGTDVPSLFASLVHGAAFGTRAIHDHLRNQGRRIDETRAVGGIPQKAPYVVQTLANVLNTPVSVPETVSLRAKSIPLSKFRNIT